MRDLWGVLKMTCVNCESDFVCNHCGICAQCGLDNDSDEAEELKKEVENDRIHPTTSIRRYKSDC